MLVVSRWRNLARMANVAAKCLVHLTAILTLIATFPHVECRCPNGCVKPFCIHSLLRLSECCCTPTEGTCCGRAASLRAHNSEQPGRCCSCQGSGTEHRPSNESPTTLRPLGCSKTVIHATSVTVTEKVTSPTENERSPVSVVSLPLTLPFHSQLTAGTHFSNSCPPSSPDLLILHQRFLI